MFEHRDCEECSRFAGIPPHVAGQSHYWIITPAYFLTSEQIRNAQRKEVHVRMSNADIVDVNPPFCAHCFVDATLENLDDICSGVRPEGI